MKYIIPILVATSACSTIEGREGSVADAATTTFGLTAVDGLTEANPLFAPCGPAAGVCALAAKEAGKEVLPPLTGISDEEAEYVVEVNSWTWACANIITITAGFGPAALIAGGVCALGYTASEGHIPQHQPEEEAE